MEFAFGEFPQIDLTSNFQPLISSVGQVYSCGRNILAGGVGYFNGFPARRLAI